MISDLDRVCVRSTAGQRGLRLGYCTCSRAAVLGAPVSARHSGAMRCHQKKERKKDVKSVMTSHLPARTHESACNQHTTSVGSKWGCYTASEGGTELRLRCARNRPNRSHLAPVGRAVPAPLVQPPSWNWSLFYFERVDLARGWLVLESIRARPRRQQRRFPDAVVEWLSSSAAAPVVRRSWSPSIALVITCSATNILPKPAAGTLRGWSRPC